MKKLLMIEGMSCGHCVKHVKSALEEIEGVMDVVVDLQRKSAIVELSVEVENGKLKEALEEAGYDVTDIRTI